ncbi:ABC transporter substrate-binding protein [Streptomyces sp. NPDC055078]
MRQRTQLARRTFGGAAVAATLVMATACSPGSGAGDSDEVKVAVVTPLSGDYSHLGKEFQIGFKAGLDHLTKGTDEVDGKKIKVAYADSTGDPTTAVSVAKDQIAKGSQFVLGTITSGESIQLAPLAAKEKVIFMPMATTSTLLGVNKYTFPSNFSDVQNVLTMLGAVGDVQGKRVQVVTHDNTYGKASLAAVERTFGKAGATILPAVKVPDSTTDFIPAAQKVKNAKPDIVAMFWALPNDAGFVETLASQRALDGAQLVRSMPAEPTFPAFRGIEDRTLFSAYYDPSIVEGTMAEHLKTSAKKFGKLGRQGGGGFRTAQMLVRAIEAGPDVEDRIKALEGWKFDSVKGPTEIRAKDHVVLQPMPVARLTDKNGKLTLTPVKTLEPAATAP